MTEEEVPAPEEVVAEMTPEKLNEVIKEGLKDPENAKTRRLVVETNGANMNVPVCELTRLELITVCHKLLKELGEE